MPRKKKVEAPAAETEVKAAETAAEVVEAPAKKTTRKTTAAKKTTAAAEAKKAAPKAEAKAEAVKAVEVKTEAPAAASKAEVIIEYGGVQVSVDEIIKNAKNVVGEDKDLKIYVQPENSKAYIAFDDQSVAIDVYFVK